MWDIPLSSILEHILENISNPNTSTPVASSVLRLDKTKQELAQYSSATCFVPVLSTLLRAIRKKHTTKWSGLTVNLINKHLPKSMHTAKVHLDQEAKKLQSTKTNQEAIEEQEDVKLPQDHNNIKLNDILCTILDFKELESKIYSDQTGRFPVNPTQGNQYNIILYHYDTNTINAVSIKNRRTKCITNVWQLVFNILKTQDEAPNLHVLNNECSYHLKQIFKLAEVT